MDDQIRDGFLDYNLNLSWKDGADYSNDQWRHVVLHNRCYSYHHVVYDRPPTTDCAHFHALDGTTRYSIRRTVSRRNSLNLVPET